MKYITTHISSIKDFDILRYNPSYFFQNSDITRHFFGKGLFVLTCNGVSYLCYTPKRCFVNKDARKEIRFWFVRPSKDLVEILKHDGYDIIISQFIQESEPSEYSIQQGVVNISYATQKKGEIGRGLRHFDTQFGSEVIVRRITLQDIPDLLSFYTQWNTEKEKLWNRENKSNNDVRFIESLEYFLSKGFFGFCAISCTGAMVGYSIGVCTSKHGVGFGVMNKALRQYPHLGTKLAFERYKHMSDAGVQKAYIGHIFNDTSGQFKKKWLQKSALREGTNEYYEWVNPEINFKNKKKYIEFYF